MYYAIYTTMGGLYTECLKDEEALEEFLDENPDVTWEEDVDDFSWEQGYNGFIIKGDILTHD